MSYLIVHLQELTWDFMFESRGPRGKTKNSIPTRYGAAENYWICSGFGTPLEPASDSAQESSYSQSHLFHVTAQLLCARASTHKPPPVHCSASTTGIHL